MEQLIGTDPYRFEVVDAETARVVEWERKGFFGQWTGVRSRPAWVSCSAVETGAGTEVTITAGGGRAPVSRALQLATLLSQGIDDARTVYRSRRIPAGPVTLVASWAGMPYHLFTEADPGAPRGHAIHTATPLWAVSEGDGQFIRVRLADGGEGYVERDEIVAAPALATRRAQLEVSRFV